MMICIVSVLRTYKDDGALHLLVDYIDFNLQRLRCDAPTKVVVLRTFWLIALILNLQRLRCAALQRLRCYAPSSG